MSLTDTEIAQALEEIGPAVREGWIQKIHQPTERTLVFEVRVPGRTHRLLVSCQPGASRIHFLAGSLPNPPSPPPFCQFLRAHIQGARIEDLRQQDQDRVVEWSVTTREGPRNIICELTGRTADLLILDEQGIVLRHLNGDHEVIGKPYRRPERKSPTLRTHAPSRFQGIGAPGDFPVSAAIEAHYQRQDSLLAGDAAKNQRLRDLKNTIKKHHRRIDAWRDDLAKAAVYKTYARYGELLKANFGQIRKGMDRIGVIDYFEESMPEVTIPLDSTKTAQGNMDEYFRKHRKYVAAERELRPRIEQAERELNGLKQEIKEIEQGTWVAPAPTLPLRLPADRRRTAGRPQERRGPFRRFTSTDGLNILVGRNAKENDELTFALAKSDDLWLHARGAPGSHVLVRMEKGKDPPPGTLQEAAMLALLYSDLKKSGKGDVVYTRRKWIKKAKGQAAGAVLVTREQSIHVSLDKARLALLKERSGQPV